MTTVRPENISHDPLLSLIIPVLGDGRVLQDNLPRLAGLSGRKQIIVVDGGTSPYVEGVSQAAGAQLVRSAPGRGLQMNAGADAAEGETLVFLHADCWLEEGALREVNEILARPGVVAGVFQQRIDGRGLMFRMIERAANLRARWLRIPYGDSGLFLRRRAFEAAGGFPPIPLCEDLGMARRLRQLRKGGGPGCGSGGGRIDVARSRIHLSARRWHERGVLRTTLLNWGIAIAYHVGVSPQRLYRAYYGRTIGERSGAVDAPSQRAGNDDLGRSE